MTRGREATGIRETAPVLIYRQTLQQLASKSITNLAFPPLSNTLFIVHRSISRRKQTLEFCGAAEIS
jgi:hypothetical protein